jgi:hypothetical protein
VSSIVNVEVFGLSDYIPIFLREYALQNVVPDTGTRPNGLGRICSHIARNPFGIGFQKIQLHAGWLSELIGVAATLPIKKLARWSCSSICPFRKLSDARISAVANGKIDVFDFSYEERRALHFSGCFVSFFENPSLDSENTERSYTNGNQATGPSPYNSRPFGYLVIGVLCVVIGIFVASYAAGYERGEKYQATQYIIESLISFALIIVACFFVAQGFYLIFWLH